MATKKSRRDVTAHGRTSSDASGLTSTQTSLQGYHGSAAAGRRQRARKLEGPNFGAPRKRAAARSRTAKGSRVSSNVMRAAVKKGAK